MPRFCANLNFLFTEVPLLDRFEAAAKAGFKAVEIGNPYDASASEIAAKLKSNNLALALINTTAGDAAKGERGRGALTGREKDFDADMETALGYCAATGCKLIHVMAGLVHQGARRDTFVANLKKGARRAAAVGVTTVIEPINRRDIPGYFLNKLAEARAIIYEVGEPNLGLQFDLYHRQVEDGDVAVAIKEYAALTRHYQIANPPDRGEPEAGDLNYRWLLQQIDAGGYQGWVGCEYKPRRGTVEGLVWTTACGVKLG
jgi:2-dehydrotetronate isomerase